MKNLILILSFAVLIPFIGLAQDKNKEISKANFYLDTRNEVYFRFNKSDVSIPKEINKIISIDKLIGDSVYAYANKKQFVNFLKKEIGFVTLTPPSLLKELKISKSVAEQKDWDSYPSYDTYILLMNQFATDYPDLCQIKNIGLSTNGRQILSVKISDNVNIKEPEPEFLYTSTMHGDELTGMILCLQLIDYMLSSYGSNNRITELIDNIEIYINPLSNPDGTYFTGNSSVVGATRFNSNGVDLNRNFPDPEDGLHPDGNPWQQETLVMMDFLMNHNFVLSANLHTGSEVINYPWDTWSTLHADNNWYVYISAQYVDSVHIYSPSSLGGYLTQFNNGITNGYEWYTIDGGRQDFVNYYLHGREVTMELSVNKAPPAGMLPLYWEANYRSLISYIEQCTYGIQGTVTDSLTGDEITAKVTAINHDFEESHIFCHPQHGNYSRLLEAGNYSLLFSALGYKDKIIENINVEFQNTTFLNVELIPNSQSITSLQYDFNATISPNPSAGIFNVLFKLNQPKEIGFIITDSKGQQIDIYQPDIFYNGENSIRINLVNESAGIYYIMSKELSFFIKIIKL